MTGGVAVVVILSEAKDLAVVILSEAKDLRFFTALRSVQNDGVEHVALRSE
jgi:DNA-binding sugar fermentation-stimulating protein